jgi:hypothetical protein
MRDKKVDVRFGNHLIKKFILQRRFKTHYFNLKNLVGEGRPVVKRIHNVS